MGPAQVGGCRSFERPGLPGGEKPIFNKKKRAPAPGVSQAEPLSKLNPIDPGQGTSLRGAADAFFRIDGGQQAQGPIDALLAVSGAEYAWMGAPSELWGWIERWVTDPSTVDDHLTRAKLGMFVDLFHDWLLPQWTGPSPLGKATDEQRSTVANACFEALTHLAPDTLIDPSPRDSMDAGTYLNKLSNQLGRPVDVLGGGGAPDGDPAPSGPNVLDQTLSEAESGDDVARYKIAYVHAKGEGDLDRALEMLEGAARLGDVDAMTEAGKLASDLGRTGVAQFWTETAANTGDPTAMFNFGITRLEAGAVDDAVAWLQAAASAGFAEGYAALSHIAEISDDEPSARRYAAQGAALDNPRCLVVHALFLFGDDPDRPAGDVVPLFERAGQLGSSEGMRLAAVQHHFRGNPVQAKYWLEHAIAVGDPMAEDMMREYGLA